MMRLHPVWAFVVTAVVMTVVLGGWVGWMILDHRAEDHGPLLWSDVVESVGLALAAASLYVTGAGAFVGLPILASLRWSGLSRQWWALIVAGLLGGVLIACAGQLISGGRVDRTVLELAGIVGGFGMVSGLMWWLLTCGTPPPPVAGQA